MMKLFLLVLFAVVAVNAQFLNDDDDQITRIMIDDFTVGGNVQKAIVTLGSDLSASDPSVIDDSSIDSPGCTGLIGCGRDMRMEAISGFGGRSFESEIFLITDGYFNGEWALANPKTSESIATIQYDGQDGTFDLDLNGLGNLDITDNGLVESLKLSVIADLPTTYTMILHSPDGTQCTADISVLAINGDYEYFDTFVEIPLSQFSGSCTRTNIGAIEITLPSDDAVDAIVRTIQFTGSPDPSGTPTPTPTRTPTPAASASNTPTPAPSNTPTRTPSPSGPCITRCVCPVFTCQLAFDLDDDVNTLSLGYTTAYDSDYDDDVTTVFVYVPDVTTVFVYVDDDDGFSTFTYTFFTTDLSTLFTSLFSSFSSFTSLFTSFTTFTYSFSSGFTSFFTSLTSFTSFTSFFTSGFTSFTSFGSFSGSSSSDASTVAASVVLVAVMAVIA